MTYFAYIVFMKDIFMAIRRLIQADFLKGGGGGGRGCELKGFYTGGGGGGANLKKILILRPKFGV